jgi:hypothetical protein
MWTELIRVRVQRSCARWWLQTSRVVIRWYKSCQIGRTRNTGWWWNGQDGSVSSLVVSTVDLTSISLQCMGTNLNVLWWTCAGHCLSSLVNMLNWHESGRDCCIVFYVPFSLQNEKIVHFRLRKRSALHYIINNNSMPYTGDSKLPIILLRLIYYSLFPSIFLNSCIT